ncbi:helix-turn-helix domain-containing protein [Vibrio parahaemolyticus]|uniref:helix-turn-helix transcriptional regulator n=1 Tax=Vibrio rotiferianus TaxID=190895 RepID=UPI00391DE4CE|nr:helix-turn-helix domain-containing protein [Vibrio parahaemolyticus]
MLTIDQVCEKLSVSRRTLEIKRKANEFPEPTCYVFSKPRWSVNELNHWLNEQNNAINQLTDLHKRFLGDNNE